MEPRSIPRTVIKTLRASLKISFTMLEKYIKIIQIKNAVKYITLQHGNNQGLVNHIDNYLSYQTPLIKALSRKL